MYRLYSATLLKDPAALYNKSDINMLMLNFIPFGWNAVLKYQHLGLDLLQVKR